MLTTPCTSEVCLGGCTLRGPLELYVTGILILRDYLDEMAIAIQISDIVILSRLLRGPREESGRCS